MLRRILIMDRWERVTITQCRYGKPFMKPTDLWGLPFPDSWHPRPMCRNGATCHERAPRGSKTGLQGVAKGPGRAEIPFELALDVCIAAEHDLAGGNAAAG
jgi:hypothetical protein